MLYLAISRAGALSSPVPALANMLVKHPERLEICGAIPRNPVGKILKKELRKEIQSRMEKG